MFGAAQRRLQREVVPRHRHLRRDLGVGGGRAQGGALLGLRRGRQRRHHAVQSDGRRGAGGHHGGGAAPARSRCCCCCASRHTRPCASPHTPPTAPHPSHTRAGAAAPAPREARLVQPDEVGHRDDEQGPPVRNRGHLRRGVRHARERHVDGVVTSPTRPHSSHTNPALPTTPRGKSLSRGTTGEMCR